MKFFIVLVSLFVLNFNTNATSENFEKVYSCFKSYPNGNIQSKISFQKLLNKNTSYGFIFNFNQYTTDYTTDLQIQIKKEISGYTEIQQMKQIEGFDHYLSDTFEMNLETFNLSSESGSWKMIKQENYLGYIDLKESINAYSLTIKILSPNNTQKVIFVSNFTCNKL
ncbi:MAG: hypothetical protein L6Q33_02975 [Bacteriovoracaceae bacterium]|jgi:hypothetical protein|nr:hypothetical protein [Bacteriovoracaceae bacterium]